MDELSDWISLILRLCAGIAVLVILYYALFGRRADFVVSIRHGQVRWKGKVPAGLQERLSNFLRNELQFAGSARIMGAYRGPHMRIWFSGQMTRAQQQRIRNLLLAGG